MRAAKAALRLGFPTLLLVTFPGWNSIKTLLVLGIAILRVLEYVGVATKGRTIKRRER